MKQRIHFIAIGGSIMHNLAIHLKEQGHNVSGSDDGFFEPSKTRLADAGLLPKETGWYKNKITEDIDVVILGMHAKKDNPELLKAQELGLTIHSFPSFIYDRSRNKQRIVIAGSHGKTTITSMILHVLKHYDRKFDYAVGAQIEGFKNMVELSDDAPYIIIEGDEYLTSPLDLTPKFFKYQHHIALISGIAWDHANVFPTKEIYQEQFEKLCEVTPKAGTIIYNTEDQTVKNIGDNAEGDDILKFTYETPKYKIVDNKVVVKDNEGKLYELNIFGKHNLNNLAAAKMVCSRLCVSEADFYTAIQSFSGAGKRLDTLLETSNSTLYRDFAHSPSKLKATQSAVKELFTDRKLLACFELHTFSSLHPDFLPEYKDHFNDADEAIVYFNPEVVAKKGFGSLSKEEVKKAFNRQELIVFDDSSALEKHLVDQNWTNKNLLLMSSGDFHGLNIENIKSAIQK